jgi:hypothetical protein
MTAVAWTAVLTGVLAGGAIVTAVFAIMAFRAQSAEVTLLQEQTERERKESAREAADRRWRQATLVYMTRAYLPPRNAFGPLTETNPDKAGTRPAFSATVFNTSGQPIYDVRIHWVDAGAGTQNGAEAMLGTVGPGEQGGPTQRAVPVNTTPDDFQPVAYFRDAAGDRWTVLTDGHLAPVGPRLQQGQPLIATTAIAQALAPPAKAAPEPDAPQPGLLKRLREAIWHPEPGE